MRYFTLMLIAVLFAVSAQAASVELAWDASPTLTPEFCATEQCGYLIRYGQDPDNFEFVKPVGNMLTTTIDNLGPGTWYFTATAYNRDAESAYSNIVDAVFSFYVAPEPIVHPPINIPMGPMTLTIQITVE